MVTPKQEKFIQGIVEGLSQADAYRAAYNSKNMSDKTIHEAASRLMADSKVSARLNELRQQITSDKIMSAQKRSEWLTELIQDNEADLNARLKALDILNKMSGEYVQKVQAAVDTDVHINIELIDE